MNVTKAAFQAKVNDELQTVHISYEMDMDGVKPHTTEVACFQ